MYLLDAKTHNQRSLSIYIYTNVHVCNDIGNNLAFRNNSSKRTRSLFRSISLSNANFTAYVVEDRVIENIGSRGKLNFPSL